MEKFKIHPVRYFDQLKSIVLFMLMTGGMALRRLCEIIHVLSEGKITLQPSTILKWQNTLAKKCEAQKDKILEELLEEEVLYVDETGVKIDGERYWVHVITGEKGVWFICTKSRGGGEEGPVELLRKYGYKGTVVHDHFSAYGKLVDRLNGECNIHILRYMRGGVKFDECPYCEEMIDLLLEAKDEKERLIENGKVKMTKRAYNKYRKKFLTICEAGMKWWDDKAADNKAYEKYQPPFYLTFKRMIKYVDDHLRFLSDFRVDFGNNKAEQQMGAIKTKMKSSRQFRSEEGADSCMTLMSLLQTARKAGTDKLKLFEECFCVQS